jgi:hypothetical protein
MGVFKMTRCAHGVDTSTHSCFACNHQGITTCKHGVQVGGAKCPICTVPGSLDELAARIPHDSILQIAEQLVNGERAKNYGPPAINFKRIADISSHIIGREITPEECVKVLMAVKLARLIESPTHRDSIIDLAGYAWVLDRVVNG